MYYVTTGRLPPDSIDRMDEDDLVPPNRLGVAISAGEEEVLLTALSVQPGERYQHMQDFMHALQTQNSAPAQLMQPKVTNIREFSPLPTPQPVQPQAKPMPTPQPVQPQAKPMPTPQPVQPQAPAKRPVVRSMLGMQANLSAGQILIGRSQDCAIVFQEGTPGISGRHCSFSFEPATGEFILTDMRSTYGTYLQNGQKLTPGVPVRLHAGDSFYLGERTNMLRVELE